MKSRPRVSILHYMTAAGVCPSYKKLTTDRAILALERKLDNISSETFQTEAPNRTTRKQSSRDHFC